MLKVNFVSLGCNKNLVDTEIMMGILAEAGFQLVDDEQAADVIVVNTCGFINDAKQESIETILESIKYKEHGKCKAVVVAGCLGQRYKEELLKEMPEIDGLIGTGEIDKVVEVIQDAVNKNYPNFVTDREFIYDHSMPRWQATPAHYAYVKIAEGCNNRCSYCAIPDIRGGYRSRPKESILEEIKELTSKGVKEINLIAQDTTGYGTDIYGKNMLAQLVEEVADLPELEWVRILYAYPNRITDELIQVIKNKPKVCKYLDIPIQHVDKKIIQRMNRQGSREEIEELINKLRREIPQITLRTTLIVGFPGETEKEFDNLLDFVVKARFDRLGVFSYSQEENTPAGQMEDQVLDEIKEERRDILMRTQQKISLDKNKNKIGSTILTLIEGKCNNGKEYVGRTQADAPEIDGFIYFTGPVLNPGDMVNVRVTNAVEYDLMGEFVDEPGQ